MKSYVFWDIMLCSPTKLINVSEEHVTSMKQVASRACFTLAYSLTLKMEATCSSKRRLTLKGLHSVISQKIELCITTAVRNSNPTKQTSILHGHAVLSITVKGLTGPVLFCSDSLFCLKCYELSERQTQLFSNLKVIYKIHSKTS
jgi:hypothetical protein